MSEPPPIRPLPVMPLEYDSPTRYRPRPGIIVAIGVISIVVAAISGIVSLGEGIQAIVFGMMSSIARTTAVASPPAGSSNVIVHSHTSNFVVLGRAPASTATQVPTQLSAGPRGYADEARSIVMRSFERRAALSPPRKEILDLLLAESGQDVIGVDAPLLNPDTIAGTISNFGDKIGPHGEAVGTFFVIGTGEIELYDDHGLFVPSDTSRETIRVSKDDAAEAITPSGLSVAEINAFVAQAQAKGGSAFNAKQAAAIKTMLSQPGQMLANSSFGPAAVQLVQVQPMANGQTTVQTYSGVITLDADGQVISTTLSPMMTPTMPKVAVGATILLGIESLLSLLLAIYLLVIGIAVLRQSLRGARLHWYFVWLKIPLVLISAYAMYWFWSSFYSSMNIAAVPNTSAFNTGLGLGYAMFSMVGIAYPVALFFTLRAKSVREYYSADGQA